MYTALIPYLAAYALIPYLAAYALIPYLAACVLPSSPILLHIYCTCFSTFWQCPPYNLNSYSLVYYLMPYYVSIFKTEKNLTE